MLMDPYFYWLLDLYSHLWHSPVGSRYCQQNRTTRGQMRFSPILWMVGYFNVLLIKYWFQSSLLHVCRTNFWSANILPYFGASSMHRNKIMWNRGFPLFLTPKIFVIFATGSSYKNYFIFVSRTKYPEMLNISCLWDILNLNSILPTVRYLNLNVTPDCTDHQYITNQNINNPMTIIYLLIFSSP